MNLKTIGLGALVAALLQTPAMAGGFKGKRISLERSMLARDTISFVMFQHRPEQWMTQVIPQYSRQQSDGQMSLPTLDAEEFLAELAEPKVRYQALPISRLTIFPNHSFSRNFAKPEDLRFQLLNHLDPADFRYHDLHGAETILIDTLRLITFQTLLEQNSYLKVIGANNVRNLESAIESLVIDLVSHANTIFNAMSLDDVVNRIKTNFLNSLSALLGSRPTSNAADFQNRVTEILLARNTQVQQRLLAKLAVQGEPWADCWRLLQTEAKVR